MNCGQVYFFNVPEAGVKPHFESKSTHVKKKDLTLPCVI